MNNRVLRLRFRFARPRRRASALLLLLMAICLPAERCSAAELLRVRSPGGNVEFRLFESKGHGLQYAVLFKHQTIIERSPLHFSVDGDEVTQHFKLGKVEPYEVHETYAWRGIHSTATNRCQGARARLIPSAGNPECTLDVRAYDDGI